MHVTGSEPSQQTHWIGHETRATSAFLLEFGILLWKVAMAQDRKLNEERVRSLDDQERVATLKRNLPELEKLWSEEFTVNAPNNKVVIGRRAVLDAFVHTSIINFSKFERQLEFIRAEGDFVFIMGLESVPPVSDAPSVGLEAGQVINRRFTNVWRSEEGTWRVFARHANVIANR